MREQESSLVRPQEQPLDQRAGFIGGLVQNGTKRSQTEALPEHRRRPHCRAMARLQTVEPRLNQGLDTHGKGIVEPLAQMPRQLLEKQRIALGALDTARYRVGFAAQHQLMGEGQCIGCAQWVQVDDRGRRIARAGQPCRIDRAVLVA